MYLDNAAATEPDQRVLRAMVRTARTYGNPSSFNDAGRAARFVLETARADIARFLNARSSEVVFCASGSEANSLALSWAREILTQPTEHQSVLRSSGKRARLVLVDGAGLVNPEEIAKAIRSSTTVVSIMYANNEVGTVQPIKKIAKVIREYRWARHSQYPLFHVDACQAAPWLTMDVQALGVDLLTLNGLKVHGPAGTAVLFVRRGVKLGTRMGTENVAGAVGLATALKLIRREDAKRVGHLRHMLIEQLPVVVPGARINGSAEEASLPNIVNISIPGVTSESLLLELDSRGIRAGAGSACTAHRVEPSHVLIAMRVPRKFLSGVLRISMSRNTTKNDIARFLRELPKAVVSCYNRTRSHESSP